MTCPPYVASNYTILLQDFYCRISKSDPNKSYNIWIHGLGITKVFFHIGMIIGNELYRQYVCRDFLVSSEDADNVDIGRERCTVSDV